ncbi:MAG: hypothetical protein ACI841_000053 [Planctomycetota bacterium]|jgi:hypothetical protein
MISKRPAGVTPFRVCWNTSLRTVRYEHERLNRALREPDAHSTAKRSHMHPAGEAFHTTHKCHGPVEQIGMQLLKSALHEVVQKDGRRSVRSRSNFEVAPPYALNPSATCIDRSPRARPAGDLWWLSHSRRTAREAGDGAGEDPLHRKRPWHRSNRTAVAERAYTASIQLTAAALRLVMLDGRLAGLLPLEGVLVSLDAGSFDS